MRIRDIEVDDEIAKEIDTLLARMSEFDIHVVRARFKAGTVAGAVTLLKSMCVTTVKGKAPTQKAVESVLEQDDPKQLLELLRRAVSRHTIRDGVWLEQQYAKIFERCTELEPKKTRDGAYEGFLIFDATNALRALENIAKLKGLNKADQGVGTTDQLSLLRDVLNTISSGPHGPAKVS